jgi:hypothetical protein
MTRILYRLALFSLSLFVAATAAAAQTAAEGRLDLRDLLARLPGRYDNEPQRFFLEGMKRAAERPARAHVVIARLEGESPVRLEIVEHDGDEHSAVRLRTTWTLAVGDDGHAELRGEGTGASCRLVWHRRAGVFVADVPAPCAADAAPAALLQAGGRLWVSAEEIWRDLPGNPRPLQLLRATEFDCFVAIRRRNGEPQALTRLRLHDRGGTVTVRTDEQPARELTLLLRHGLWPSVSGNNFVQLMNLYLFEEPGRRMLGNGWATPDSGRVGFGVGDEDSGGQSASARCTRVRT